MKIVALNAASFGSTGNIMLNIAEQAKSHQHETTCFCGITKLNKTMCEPDRWKPIGNFYSRAINIIIARMTGYLDCFSQIDTLNLISYCKKIKPDLIHLHNLHGGYLNLKLLFDYIKEYKIPVVWTLHDCWAFTGQCPYFELAKCSKWKNECYHCPQHRSYPQSYIDKTRRLHQYKKMWFKGVEYLTVVTPSHWLAGLVQESFLNAYPIKVINNGVNLQIFKPTLSDFRARNSIVNKYLILGVAFGWGVRKGFDVFLTLANQLDEHYQIVLVGTDETLDQQLPKNIISIHRTKNQEELAQIYSAADIFVNPTREDNFPTVNIEALACGTPVITFDTGGSPEIIDHRCGSVVAYDDTDMLRQEIIRVCTSKPYSTNECLKRAALYNMDHKFEEYIELYESIMSFSGR